MRKKVIPVFGLLCFVFIAAIYGQSAWYGFVEEPVDPRSIGMGSAGTALGAGGFAFYNPAGISLRSEPWVSINFGKLSDDLRRGFLETGWIFPKWFFGVSFQSQSIDFQRTTEQGEIEDAFGSEQASMGSFSIGLRRNRFAVAIAANGIQHRMAETTSYVLTVSGGAVFELISGKLNAGAAFTHVAGRNTKYLEDDNSLFNDELPQSIRGGVAWHDTLKGTIPYNAAVDIAYSDNYETVMVPAGIEVWVLPLLSLRLGKRFNHPTDVLTAGMGLKWKNIKFDAAFVPCNFEGDKDIKWTMGFTYRLPDIKSRRNDNTPKKVANDKTLDQKNVSDTIKEPVEIPVKDMEKPEKTDKVQIPTEVEKNVKTDNDTNVVEQDVSIESEIDQREKDENAGDTGNIEIEKGEDEDSTDSSFFNKDKEEQTSEDVQIEKSVVDSTKNSSEKNTDKGGTGQDIEIDTSDNEEVEKSVNEVNPAVESYNSNKE